MELSVPLKQAIEKQAEGIKQKQLQQISQKVSYRYKFESGAGKRLVTQNDEAVVYSIVRMPATFGAVTFALEEIKELYDFQLESLLDVGAGTGAASWGIDALFSLDDITCLEREKEMINVGRQLMKNGSAALKNTVWKEFDITKDQINVKKDIVVSSYMLNELTAEKRMKAVDQLWHATKELLLIVEPGTPEGFKVIREIREHLLSQGAYIIAPCPCQKNCPIQEPDWCHFSCRIGRTKLHKILKSGEVGYEDEKFSYLAFTKKEISHSYARILRHPFIEKGKITVVLCEEGNIYKKVFKKKDGDLYKRIRKAKWGNGLYINKKEE